MPSAPNLSAGGYQETQKRMDVSSSLGHFGDAVFVLENMEEVGTFLCVHLWVFFVCLITFF